MKKTILITGASSGIGKTTAKYFQEKGWNVVATMRKPEQENELTQLENVKVTKLDVLDLESIDHAIQEGIATFGKIDVLLNNAGYGAFGPLEAFPREDMVRQFNTNVIGLLDVTKGILPHFRKNMDGVLINISSIGGRLTFPLGSLYHGTKFAVEGISEALNYELGAIGVKVKIIEPGYIATDFSGRSFDFKNDESMTEYQSTVGTVFKSFDVDPSNISPPSVVAEVIYQAATDGTSTLRYRAGADAEELLSTQKATNDEDFISIMKKRYNM